MAAAVTITTNRFMCKLHLHVSCTLPRHESGAHNRNNSHKRRIKQASV